MRTNDHRSRAWAGLVSIALVILFLLVPRFEGDVPASASPADRDRDRPASIRDPVAGRAKLANKREHCSVDPDYARLIGRAEGQQVRVYRGDSDFAVFTLDVLQDEELETIVRMGRLARLRFGSSDEFEGRIVPELVLPGLSEEQARTRGELVERLDDDSKNTGLLVLAPHGGQIEPPTDLQAERIAEKMGPNGVSTWRCKGYHPRGGKAAYDRWHITSTDIHEASYPQLARVANRKFRHVVSFHGMTDDRILIGGSAPTRLRQEIRDAIRAAINDPGVAVDLALPGDANGGKDPRNIVNRYARDGGVQIEQSSRARREHWKAIADAVAKVFASKF